MEDKKNLCLDDFGRVIIQDDELLELVQGASLDQSLLTDSNSACHDNAACGDAACGNGGC